MKVISGNPLSKSGLANKVSIAILVAILSIVPVNVTGSDEQMLLVDSDTPTGSTNTKLGWNMTEVGDLLGDGDRDFAIGAPGQNKVYIWDDTIPIGFTTATGAAGSPDWIITGDSNSNFGWSLAGMGDYDKDGFDDLVVGAPGEDKVYVFSSPAPSTAWTTSSADITINGRTGELFGHSVASLAYDGSANRFLVVGAPKNNHIVGISNFTTGAAFVYNISNIDALDIHSMPWHKYDINGGFAIIGDDTTNKNVGFSVVNIGDANADTKEDIGVSDPYQQQVDAVNNGAFYIDYGKTMVGHLPEVLAQNANGVIYGYNNSFFGWTTSHIGDIGSSAEDDIAIGAPLYGGGEAYIIYGTTTAIKISLFQNAIFPDFTFNGSANGDRLGTSIIRSDIVPGSNPQIFVGAPGYDNGTIGKDAGALYGFYNPSGGVNDVNNAKTSYIGEFAGDNLGYSMMEVNYTSTMAGRLSVSAPFFGSTNAGKLYILQRNSKPAITQLLVSPATGNLDTDFTISVVYMDVDADPPKYINLHLYTDEAGTNLIDTKSVPLTLMGGTLITGARYELVTKLPNSVVYNIDEELRNIPIYIKAESEAVRGSTAVVFSGIQPKEGPIVDGKAPSAATNIYTTDGVEVGTFNVFWWWPGEDDFDGGQVQGKVETLTIKINKDQPIDESNWDISILYRDITFTDVKDALSPGSTVIGAKSDIMTNPNGIDLIVRNSTDHAPKKYFIAMRAVDEEGNVGDVAGTQSDEWQEPFWTRPVVPSPLDSPTLVDVPNDSGGMLLLTWIGSSAMDTEYYWVFVDDQPFESIMDEGGAMRVPEYNISRLGNPDIFFDTNNNSRGVIITTMNGQPLENGKTYYVAVVAVNWLMQFDDGVTVSAGAKVIDNKAKPIDRIADLSAESTSTPGNLSITLHWTPTTDAKFTEYLIYAQSYSVNNVGDAIMIGRDTNKANSSFVVTKIAGDLIRPGVQYSFMILITDYNDHVDLMLVRDENYIHPVRVKDTVKDPMQQVMGVTLRDRPSDGGGVLEIFWDQLITAGRFWCYNVYFSEEPITDVSDMEPLKTLFNFKAFNETLFNTTGGDPLIDGRGYYAAVTIVDWNDVENMAILEENTKGPVEPINQSDNTKPMGVGGLRSDIAFDPEGKIKDQLKVLWNPVSFEQVPDFNRYILVYTSPYDPSTPLDVEIMDRTESSILIKDLRRFTNYFINISIVDDNGNRGSGGIPINITTGGRGVAPWNLTVKISLTFGMDQNMQITNLTEGQELKVDIKDVYPGSNIYFTGIADDDYTSVKTEAMKWSWNLTAPDGTFINRDFREWNLKVSDMKPGQYTIRFKVTDGDDMSSEIIVKLTIKEESKDKSNSALILIAILVVVIILGIIIAFVVMRSSKSSQEKEMMKQYEDRKKEIDAMEPIYVNLPSWTCSCGTTLVNINKGATCPSCYESFEAVPIDGIDNYLKDHELVLSEMRIGIPLGWQGQKYCIDQAETDLVDRKKRAREALDEQFAPFIKKKEAPAEEQKPSAETLPGGPSPTPHTPGTIPGQLPPAQMAPSMGQPPVMGNPQPYQPQPPAMTQYPPK
jgi:hypothetical protein